MTGPAQRPSGPDRRPRILGGRGALTRLRLGMRRTGVGSALILLALIVLPSAFLGYLSWQAIENEKSYSFERLRESYRQFARLAARQIDHQLGELETRWAAQIEGVLGASDSMPSARDLSELEGGEPLIAGCYLLGDSGSTVYPPVPLDPSTSVTAWGQVAHAREFDLFKRLVAEGEDLEYRNGDYEAAIAAYQRIANRVSNPPLRAMAESYVGRVQLKAADWSGALETFRRLLQRYPTVRDLNRMYLRFLAQYQMAVALEGLGRDQEALDVLVELNRDLLRRSDAINAMQYSYYSDLIQSLAPRLLTSPRVPNRERYDLTLRALGERNKKRIGESYFLHLLDGTLSEMVIRRRHFSPKIHYLSGRADGEAFLLAYRALPDRQRVHVSGIIAIQVDLERLRAQVFPAIRNLSTSSDAALAILGSEGNEVIGSQGSGGTPIATQNLLPPFNFWEVAVYARDIPTAMKRLDLRATLWLWLISLLLVIIMFGAYVFILRVRRESDLLRAQTTFISNVTHELKTPLSSIRMFAELLEMQMAQGGSQVEFRTNAEQGLGIIRQECDRLTRLIDRVLDFSKLERRVRQYHFEQQDLVGIVSNAVESFRPHAEARGFKLELEAGEEVPTLKLDADAISQVLLNLLSNAAEYSGEVREIRVKIRRDENAVAIDVSDRGVGIGRKEIGRIFDKFYTSRKRMDSRTQSGLGLGLTLSREIVRAHGGDIQVASEVGVGSTFSVLLPVGAEAVETARVREGPREFRALGWLAGRRR